MRKTGLKTKGADATAADKSLEEERKTFNTDGKKEHGFTSSVVPTLEEKLIAETQLDHSHEAHTNGDANPAENGHADPTEAKADDELMGAPANSDPKHDDHVPGTRRESHSEIEEKAVEARGVLRKQLGSKFSTKTWAVPTPTPHVDPHGFEDPVCEEFWKRTWVACAVHNVSCCKVRLLVYIYSLTATDGDLSQGLPRHSR